MSATRTASRAPSWLREGLCTLIMLFLAFSLLCCSTAKKSESSEQLMLDAVEARKTGPLPGDVRVIDGVEWVYGRNVKYMDNAAQPLNVWLLREHYTPSTSDTMPGRVGYPTKKTKEMLALEERLAKLEQQVRGGSAPKVPPSDQPVKDAAGKTWIRYFRNDDGVEWFMGEGTPSVSGNTLTMWRRRTFPTWAFQKEIVTLDDLNCRQARYRTRELRVTNWDGSSRASDKVTPWTPIFSNSPEDYLMTELCK